MELLKTQSCPNSHGPTTRITTSPATSSTYTEMAKDLDTPRPTTMELRTCCILDMPPMNGRNQTSLSLVYPRGKASIRGTAERIRTDAWQSIKQVILNASSGEFALQHCILRLLFRRNQKTYNLKLYL